MLREGVVALLPDRLGLLGVALLLIEVAEEDVGLGEVVLDGGRALLLVEQGLELADCIALLAEDRLPDRE